jgi:putative nucleotidyltransferase with HDIG domain
MFTPEQIQENYEQFVELTKRAGDDRQEQIGKLLAHFEERLALCPASHYTEYHNCFPGGLIDHSLRVLKLCNRLAKAAETQLNKESMIFCCLFHDLGKLGDPEHEYYLPQMNDYNRNKGYLYEYSKDIIFMEHAHRSIFNLQYFNIPMTTDEFVAILIHDGPNLPANEKYSMRERTLSLLVHQADRLSVDAEKLVYKQYLESNL